VVPPNNDHSRIEQRIEELKASLAKLREDAAQVNPEWVAGLSKAIDDIGDQLVDLSRRIKRLEDSDEEWTTRGWIPPSGADTGPAA
jgi:chaperonin cofactor prefoldin